MIHLLLFLFFIACLGIAAAWVAENPGSVTIHWFDYRIDTSFAFMMLLLLLACAALAYAIIFTRHVLRTPGQMVNRRSLSQYRKGLAELTYSVAALASADVKGAEVHTRKAEKLLGATPLTLLLSAQISRSQGDDARTHLLLEKMLEHKETEYIAARFLSDTAGKQQQFPKALALAQRAHAINPKGIASVVSLHVRLGQWQEARAAITRAMRKGHLSHSEKKRHQGIVHLEQGMRALGEGRGDIALAAAKHALRELPDFSPAVLFAAKAFATAEQPAKSLRIISHGWKRSPHPQLGELFLTLIIKEPKDKQMKLARRLANLQPDDVESQIVLAQATIRARDWNAARKALSVVLAKEETVRGCKLMAEIEQGQRSDAEAAAKWLARSSTAAPDAAWTCSACSHTPENWQAHCPSCGAFDTLEWKKRELKFAA